MTTFTPAIKIDNFAHENNTLVIADDIETAEAIMNYLGIEQNLISWVVKEIKYEGKPLPHSESYWMGIYNLIKN